jgi:hypothetical protein
VSGVQIFVALCGLASLALSVAAILRVMKTPEMGNKPLWVFGCLCGFIGFSVGVGANPPGDLMMEFGIQLPPINFRWSPGEGAMSIKAMFPIIAVVALARARKAGRRPSDR